MSSDSAPRCNALLVSLVSFCAIWFFVWAVSAGKRYREEYAQATPSWLVGTTRAVELTVVREDRTNLECAANGEIAGLRCAHRRGLPAPEPTAVPEAERLQPYNTTSNELLLGAGLWLSPEVAEHEPLGRFTVVCNYAIKGVMRSALVRFSPASAFAPLGRTVTAGTLTDCTLPR